MNISPREAAPVSPLCLGKSSPHGEHRRMPDPPQLDASALHRLASAKQWERLLDLADPLLAEQPESAELHGLAGQAALHLDQHARAKRHLESCLGLDPDDPWPHCLMAELYRKENRVLYAKGHLLKALSIDPENGMTWLQYGWNCASRDDWKSAREAVGRAQALLPENADVASLAATANAHSDGAGGTKGDAYAQLEELEEALAHDPEDDFVHFRMGVIYLEQLDDLDNAEERLRTALTLDPSNKQYRHVLFLTLRRRDPLLRILYGPKHLHESREAAGRSPVLPMFLFVATAPFFLVPAMVYERMVLADLRRNTGQLGFDERGFAGSYRWPFYLRFASFVLLSAAFLVATFWFLLSPTLADYRGELLGAAFVIFLVVGFIIAARSPYR